MIPPTGAVDPHQLRTTLEAIASMASQYLSESLQGDVPVRRDMTPDEIRASVAIEPPAHGRPLEDLFDDLREVLNASVRTSHPRFANQLFVGADLTGIVSEWITALHNTTMATFEMSPVATIMERDLIAHMCKIIGFSEGEGTFTAGGTISNLMAVTAARDWAYPNARAKGMAGEVPPAIFTSADAHYSLARAANILGLGINAIYPVEVDSDGRMQPAALRAQINKSIKDGRKPFFVCATAGTTVACAFDPINDIADIAREFSLWLHVDGAYGGGVLLSAQHRYLLSGVERADSMTWCPHKVMGLPIVCSALLIRRPGHLQNCLAVQADYIFHETEETTNDIGPISLQCGRRIDSIKVWLAWQVNGADGFEARVNKFFENREYFTQQIRDRKHFELVRQPHGLNVLFHYVPENLRHLPHGPERRQALGIATREIRERVKSQGNVMVNYATVDGHSTFRMVHINPWATREDLDQFLDEIERASLAISQASPQTAAS